MGLWLRLTKLLLTTPFRPRLGWDEESRLEFRVWPSDLDINLHMNNARYLAVMDIGRFDLILRSGLGRLVWRRRLKPVLASTMVRYRRSLAPFEAFSLFTRIVGWDEKWLFIEHRIERRGQIVCQAMVKGMFLAAKGGVPTKELIAALGSTQLATSLPDWVADWQSAEAALRR